MNQLDRYLKELTQVLNIHDNFDALFITSHRQSRKLGLGYNSLNLVLSTCTLPLIIHHVFIHLTKIFYFSPYCYV